MTRISSNLRLARRRPVLAAAALAVTATVATAALSAATFAPQAGQRIDMKVLLLANTAGDPDIGAWEDHLKREGTPYVRINGNTTLTAATFADGERAKYQGVIVAGADGTRPSGQSAEFSDAEWALLLRAFEAKFGIRQLDVNAYPGPPLGLNFPGSTGTLDGQTATLTAAGLAQFASLKGPVPFEDLSPSVSESFGASATPCDGVAVATCNATSFETVLQSSAGASLVGIAQTKDGREEMVSTFTANQFQVHSQILRHAMLSWVTGGVFIGRDRSYLSVDIDDIFLPDDRWNPDLNRTPEPPDPLQQDLRMTAADVQTLINFQRSKGVKLNMLFNAKGIEDAREANAGVDALSDALLASKAQFPWINHTFSHASLGSPNPESVSQATIESEISQNVQWAQGNALPNFNPSELVTGEHSGIGTSNPAVAPNANMGPALDATGITTIGADNSREIGQRQVGNATTLPRYPMNVFYNVSTWADQLDEYDWLYLSSTAAPAGRGNCTNSAATTCFSAPVTQAQFIDREASAVVKRMLGNDPRPHYAHQTNIMADSANPNIGHRGDGILYAVIGEAIDRYRSYFSVPLEQPGMTALKDQLRRQIAWSNTSSSQVTGYIQDGKVTIVSTVSRDVPITGTTAGDIYGGQRSGWLSVTNGTRTLDLEEPRNTVAPVISGSNTVGSTLTTTAGTFTGAPTITSRQWQRRTPGDGPWTSIPGATNATYAVTAADLDRQLRFVTTAANRRSTWGMGLSAPVTVTVPNTTTPPSSGGGPGATAPPAGGKPGATTPPAGTARGGGAGSVKGSTRAPAFTCKVKRRGKRLSVSCTVRNTSGGLRTARIRALRGKRVVGRASGRVRGNRLPTLLIKRAALPQSKRITIAITVKLASGRTRSMTRTLKL